MVSPQGKMQGKGQSVGDPDSMTCSGSKTLKRCKNNGEADNVVLIDVDSDNLNNVIIVDIPESLKQKLRCSSVRRKNQKYHLRTIICIDDEENSDSNHPGMGIEGGVDFCNDASSSGRFRHARNSVDAVGNECQFVQENLPPLKLSKCKRTYSGKASNVNRYGFGPESDSGSSDNDCPDCEFMEDSFGKLREQWEKANIKKKYQSRHGQSDRRDQATTSGLHTGTQQKVVVENMTDQHTEAQVCPTTRSAKYEKEDPSPFVQTGDGSSGSTSNSPSKTPFADFGLKSTQETQSSNSKVSNSDRRESFPADPSFNNAERQTYKHDEYGGSSFLDEEDHCSQQPSFHSSHDQGNKQVNHGKKFSQDKEKTPPAEPCVSNPEPTVDINFGSTKASLPDEEVSFFRTRHSVEIEVDHGIEKLQEAHSCYFHFPNESEEASSSSVDNAKLVSGEPSFQNIEQSNEMQVNRGVADNEVGAVPAGTFCEGPPLGKTGIGKETDHCQAKVKPVLEVPSFCSIPHNVVHTQPNMGARELSGEFMSNHQQEEEKDGPLPGENGEISNAVQSSIINEREKLKETDEYKRAAEEEWASRQRELQLQAEEAQKLRQLRKRKKAESMRLLDMERRQKQRVEEMREIQKKDEENMNLKEQLRAEVRKELKKLETTCQDMASLLRGLGVHVGGGFQPLPHEVRAAYKRALLSFHPDRASGSDLHQLVEAEEKFKLISRMKEKFPMTS